MIGLIVSFAKVVIFSEMCNKRAKIVEFCQNETNFEKLKLTSEEE